MMESGQELPTYYYEKLKKVDLFWPWKEVSQVSENFLQKTTTPAK